MTRTGPPEGTGRPAAGVFLLAAVAVLCTGCGAASLSVDSVPFPAKKAVFVDESGGKTAALPHAPEPLRLVFFDAPWCPQCGRAWMSVVAAVEASPPGSVHVYRILFDRERLYARNGSREVPPLHGAPPPGTGTGRARAQPVPVTTLTALPGPFRKAYRADEVPLLLLLDREGRVIARWTGSFPSMDTSIADAIRRTSESPPPAGR